MSPFNFITIITLGFLATSSFSHPSLNSKELPALSHRADDTHCFTSSFGINDFKTFSGSSKSPAFVSFKTGSAAIDGQLLCSRSAGRGSRSPFFADPIPCNKTGSEALPNIWFAYPEQDSLRLYQLTNCGKEE
jgi:hypothetical protein